jgi:hypothetical protein
MSRPREARLTENDIQNWKEEPGTVRAVANIPDLSLRWGTRSATYYVILRDTGGRQRWVKIGRTNQVTLKAAEAQSIRIAERIRAGDIPKEVSPEEVTLANIVEDYRVNVGQYQHRWRDKNRRLKKMVAPAIWQGPVLEHQKGSSEWALERGREDIAPTRRPSVG